MYCMVVFYMSTGFTNKQGAELLKLKNKTIFLHIFFSLVFCRSLVFLYECLMRAAWLQMWGEERRDKGLN